MIRVTLILFFGSVLPSVPQVSDQVPAQAPAPPDRTSDPTATEAASQLAARISSLLPRRSTASFEFQNLTQLPAAEWSSFRSRLLDELGRLGVKTAGSETAATQPEPRVGVTLSVDSRGLLLVAEVVMGDSRQVAMLRWHQPTSPPAKPPITIIKKDLWTQKEPILDVLLKDSASEMLVLNRNEIASYRFVDGTWTPSATASFVLPRPMPRDPRGRLEPAAAGFRAYLPTGTCDSTLQPELKLTCSSRTATWQSVSVHWVADRNLLEGDAPAPSFEGWGSDWASIADPCGAETVVLASSANNERDSVRAYLVRDGRADPVSDPLPLPGPATALLPAESAREATLVVHNLQTGEYEASRLGVACSQ